MTAASTVTEVAESVALHRTPRGLEVTAQPREIQIGWGGDTRCDGCLCSLPAGATGYATNGGVICVDCRERETEDQRCRI